MCVLVIRTVECNPDNGVNTITFFIKNNDLEESIKRSWELGGIEEGVKNSFRWVWLEEKYQNEQFPSEYIRKVNIPGKALCTYCNSLLNYSSGGKKDIKNHSKNKKYVQMVNLRKIIRCCS